MKQGFTKLIIFFSATVFLLEKTSNLDLKVLSDGEPISKLGKAFHLLVISLFEVRVHVRMWWGWGISSFSSQFDTFQLPCTGSCCYVLYFLAYSMS